MNYKLNPRDAGLKYPRRKKVKSRLGKTPESTLQAAVEQYLDLKGMRWLHVPDSIYRLCAMSAPTPIHIKHEISKYLKGVPDLLVFKGDRYIGIELKRLNATARQAQKKWMKGLNVYVVDKFPEAVDLIDRFNTNMEVPNV